MGGAENAGVENAGYSAWKAVRKKLFCLKKNARL